MSKQAHTILDSELEIVMKTKLQKKERNAEAEDMMIPGTYPTHREQVEQCRAMGEKTWIKPRHEKKAYKKFGDLAFEDICPN